MDLTSTFIKRFGDLVALLRVDPANDAAQDLALTAAAAAVEHAPVEVDARPERCVPHELSLQARMLARQVDRLRISAGAEPQELLALARALAHDITPVTARPFIEIHQGRAAASAPVEEAAGSLPPGPEVDPEIRGDPALLGMWDRSELLQLARPTQL
ncbi:MAG: hypothetical protein ACR2HK_03930 [Gemmatimonadales bacterium]